MRPPKADLEPIWAARSNKVPAPTIQHEPTVVDLREALAGGIALVESAFAHVSHGGPTRGDAEKWLESARSVLRAAPKPAPPAPINAAMVKALMHDVALIHLIDSEEAYEWLAEQLNRNVNFALRRAAERKPPR